MKSYFNGCGTGDTKLHMIEYFDGNRIRQIELFTLCDKVYWSERYIPDILEKRMDYKTVKRRIAAYEKRIMKR